MFKEKKSFLGNSKTKQEPFVSNFPSKKAATVPDIGRKQTTQTFSNNLYRSVNSQIEKCYCPVCGIERDGTHNYCMICGAKMVPGENNKTICISSKIISGNVFDDLQRDAKMAIARYISQPTENHFEKLFRKNFQTPVALIDAYYSEDTDKVSIRFHSPISSKIINDAQFSLTYGSLLSNEFNDLGLSFDALLTTVEFNINNIMLVNDRLKTNKEPYIKTVPFCKQALALLTEKETGESLLVNEDYFFIKEKNIISTNVKTFSMEEYKNGIRINNNAFNSKNSVNQNNALTIDYIDNCVNGIEFESLMKSVLEENGFSNDEVTKASGDYGVDIIAYKEQIKYAIQCKKYASAVGVSAIQEVIGSKSMYNCHVAVVLTNNTFTSSAVVLAEKNNVLLWGREKLIELLKNYDGGVLASNLKNNNNKDVVTAFLPNIDPIIIKKDAGTIDGKKNSYVKISSEDSKYASVANTVLCVLGEALSHCFSLSFTVEIGEEQNNIITLDRACVCQPETNCIKWLENIHEIIKEETYASYALEIIKFLFNNFDIKPDDYYDGFDIKKKKAFLGSFSYKGQNFMQCSYNVDTEELLIMIKADSEQAAFGGFVFLAHVVQPNCKNYNYIFTQQYNGETLYAKHDKENTIEDAYMVTDEDDNPVFNLGVFDPEGKELDQKMLALYTKTFIEALNKINCVGFIDELVEKIKDENT